MTICEKKREPERRSPIVRNDERRRDMRTKSSGRSNKVLTGACRFDTYVASLPPSLVLWRFRGGNWIAANSQSSGEPSSSALRVALTLPERVGVVLCRRLRSERSGSLRAAECSVMVMVEDQVAPDGPRASYPIVAGLTDAERFNKTIVLDSDITTKKQAPG